MKKLISCAIVVVASILLLSCNTPSRPAPGPTAPLRSLIADGVSNGLTKMEGQALHNLEQIGSVVNPYSQQAVSISLGSDVQVQGWAVDKVAQSVASGVEVVIDGKPCKAQYGSDRGDVADYYKVPGYTKSGFLFVIPARSLEAGRHELALRVLSKDGKSFYEGMTVALQAN